MKIFYVKKNCYSFNDILYVDEKVILINTNWLFNDAEEILILKLNDLKFLHLNCEMIKHVGFWTIFGEV
jgi:hypothetical protein